jgi:hypothetical protein
MPVSKPTSTPEPDWTAVGPNGHGVQFYQSDERLVLLLSNYVGTALVTGGTAIVVATSAHRRGLCRCLRARGLDFDVARAEGRFLTYDAADTLARFVVNGAIDRTAFRDVASEMVGRLSLASDGGRRRVTAFGEMVSLLWMSGLKDAAIALEEVWNELLDTREFSLCCAYPMSLFTGHQDAAPFLRICAQHSNIFPAEDRTRSRWSSTSYLTA